MQTSCFRRSALPRWARSVTLAVSAIAGFALSSPWGVAGATPKTPDEIRQARVLGTIEDRVRIDLETAGGELDHAEIAVEARPGGLVVLSGRVPSPEAKVRAAQLARFAVGVSEVDDALEIDPRLAPPAPAVRSGPPETGINANAPDSSPPSDEALAERVARHLAKSLPLEARAMHRWLRGWSVEGEAWSFAVDADDGTVRLEGSLREPATAEDVVASAGALPAVRDVDASLEIVDSDHRPGFFERIFR